MQVGVASREARGGDSNELLFAAVSSLEGGEIIDANEQLASVARESERFAHSWQQAKQDSFFLHKSNKMLQSISLSNGEVFTLHFEELHRPQKRSINKAGKGLHQSIQVCDATSYKAYNR